MTTGDEEKSAMATGDVAADNTVARFSGNGVIAFDKVDLGPVPPGEVRLRVEVCALCGSDKRLLAAGSPVVPGHEIAGVVVDVGDAGGPADAAGHAVRVGTRGIVYIPVYCGSCAQCAKGRTNRCLRLGELIGWQRDGGFADYVDVPARCVIPVPDDIGLDVAVLGLDTVGTAAHGLRMALATQPDPPQRLLVVGCGPLGLGVVAVAQQLGVPEVHAFDPNDARLALARAGGARQATDVDSENQYDIAVEVSGAEPARELAQRVIVPGGAVLALGESNSPYTMPATPRWRRTDCFTVRSFYFPLDEVADNWELLRRCGPTLRDRLATPLTLPDLPEAFESFAAGDQLKPFIVHTAH
ncbi:alcohol dehydrogenase catalytic domain-containing protein [Phytoactinopolyspora halotolerans]|uniref:Alcohol dehydrogenase catalytic domain-containing protein n=1 Tax=Phytoactinopolyspora halotolerans TaxID=1981512 RepID=A0A6L9S6R6_9ACTN|nr:alcohol dehydrogenase catalytic domain-containing protein [Phytoactinopolyspora halotolerans]NEE00707.1 alcohol dehydrogenase catalytic domain-containing protein [Phytoactinopolyspora halotolerans]